ncbi:MAG: pectate lyase [Chitinophagales bacterium]
MKKITTNTILFAFFLLLSVTTSIFSQTNSTTKKNKNSVEEKSRNFPSNWWATYKERDTEWFRSKEAKNIADNIISWQTPEGGWPLMNTTNEPWTGDESAIGPWGRNGTLIYATTNEIRFLSNVFIATQQTQYKDAAIKGIHYIFDAQTPTGGWPKAFPIHSDDYKRHITFNDGCMENGLTLLKDLYTDEKYSFLDSTLVVQIKERYNLGIECILKCQIVTNGKLTGWCQQHDEKTCQPRPGRTFEPAAISGSESIGIIKLLMEVENPTLEVKKSIEAAVQWIEASKIEGFAVETIPDSTFELRKIDRKVVANPNSVLWARYYEIDTNRPIFLGRDGITKYHLAEIEQERRTGYAWYGEWGKALNEIYTAWATKWGVDISNSTALDHPKDGYFITSDSLRIHYLTKGEGTPIILIHGLSGTAYGNWYKNGIADTLAKNHFVVALDCRNHGLSDKPAGGELAWGSETEVIELMNHLNIDKAHFHGYSMGGAIIGQLMAKVPERFITASMGGYGIPETDSVWIAKIPEESKGVDPDAKEAYQKLVMAYLESKGMNEKEIEEFINTPRPPRPKILPPPLTIDLTQIEFPVMTILGEFDRAVGKSHRMKRQIKNFRHVVLPGKSHNTAIMADYIPSLYIESLVDFIDSNDK